MKYWAYMNGEVPGCYEPAELAALMDFGMTTLVCPAEGEIVEKNWRRAGEFEDITRAVEAQQPLKAPRAPLPPPAAGPNADVDSILDAASSRLFGHVADLMKELETRRDEKSLVTSLQRQISALKQELATAREQVTILEIRMPRLAELEESQRKDRAALESAQASVQRLDTQMNEYRALSERLRAELEDKKRSLQEKTNDLAIRNRLIDKISKDLSDKDLSLAKSLGVIRRLEEDLSRLSPAYAQAAHQPAAPSILIPTQTPPAAPEDLPAPAKTVLPPVVPIAAQPVSEPLTSAPNPTPEALPHVESVPSSAATVIFTSDDPPPPPPYIEPPMPGDWSKAQEALMNFFKKVFPGAHH